MSKVNLRNAGYYIQRYLMIRTKAGRLVPLQFNPPQQKLYRAIAEQAKAGRPIRVIILKARQMGFSTVTGGLIFHRTATRELVESLVVAHQGGRNGKPVCHVPTLLRGVARADPADEKGQ